jgi:hypothetical protein
MFIVTATILCFSSFYERNKHVARKGAGKSVVAGCYKHSAPTNLTSQ